MVTTKALIADSPVRIAACSDVQVGEGQTS